ncbi:MAG: BrnT family toxin [Bacteroidetes bacterium]|nr:BrnT family toxin [Bacteroidota bacterium]
MPHFDWDEPKNKFNQQKHGIDFEHAKEVFDDEDAIAYPGQTKDGENRILLVGKILGKFIIAVVFTIRQQVYRIISARHARKNEVKDYITNKFRNLGND